MSDEHSLGNEYEGYSLGSNEETDATRNLKEYLRRSIGTTRDENTLTTQEFLLYVISHENDIVNGVASIYPTKPIYEWDAATIINNQYIVDAMKWKGAPDLRVMTENAYISRMGDEGYRKSMDYILTFGKTGIMSFNWKRFFDGLMGWISGNPDVFYSMFPKSQKDVQVVYQGWLGSEDPKKYIIPVVLATGAIGTAGIAGYAAYTRYRKRSKGTRKSKTSSKPRKPRKKDEDAQI
jgi:hypothetical protein